MKFKYPSTPHLPQSRSRTGDDSILSNDQHFIGKNVVITEKMDGESFSGYRNGSHARSLDSQHHPSRDWVKSFWAQRQYNLPDGWRVCGENLYAQHSIRYENLQTYFYGFSIWDSQNFCLSFDETLEWFETLDIVMVPILYRGPYDHEVISNIIKTIDINISEGFVVRNENKFHYNDFKLNMAKWVRPKHVQTEKHWMHSEIIPNSLTKK